MNSSVLLLSFLAILCLGPWTTARGVYETLRKNSVEATEESSKKISAETAGLPIISGLIKVASQARSWAQWLRRLLKTLRKWQNSHPPEVKLGKCFARYFSIKIPGLRQNEVSKGNQHPELPSKLPEGLKIRREAVVPCNSQKKSFKIDSSKKNLLFLLLDFYSEMKNLFMEYRDVMLRDELIVCLLEYFWKKFWNWVDSAPDSPCKTAK